MSAKTCDCRGGLEDLQYCQMLATALATAQAQARAPQATLAEAQAALTEAKALAGSTIYSFSHDRAALAASRARLASSILALNSANL